MWSTAGRLCAQDLVKTTLQLGKLRLGKTQRHAKVIQWAGSWHLRDCACVVGGISSFQRLHPSIPPSLAV